MPYFIVNFDLDKHKNKRAKDVVFLYHSLHLGYIQFSYQRLVYSFLE